MSTSNGSIQRVHPVIGQCIYCGKKDDLSDEHTVPLALNGASILRKASCPKCRDITSAFERSVTRDTLEIARAVMQYNTRRPKRRKKAYPVKVKINGEVKTVDMPVDAYAALVPVIDLGFPTYLVEKYSLSGPEYRIGRSNTVSVTVSRSPEKTRAFLDSIGAELVNPSTTFDAYEYARMLAKIAYCEAVYLLGLENIKKVFLLDFILEKKGDPWQHIGGLLEFPSGIQVTTEPGNPDIRAISIINGEIRAFIQLFSPLNAPKYIIVVGEVTDEYRKTLHEQGYDDA
jgi:hypothetical protein